MQARDLGHAVNGIHAERDGPIAKQQQAGGTRTQDAKMHGGIHNEISLAIALEGVPDLVGASEAVGEGTDALGVANFFDRLRRNAEAIGTDGKKNDGFTAPATRLAMLDASQLHSAPTFAAP